jgi:hypothetical protein
LPECLRQIKKKYKISKQHKYTLYMLIDPIRSLFLERNFVLFFGTCRGKNNKKNGSISMSHFYGTPFCLWPELFNLER